MSHFRSKRLDLFLHRSLEPSLNAPAYLAQEHGAVEGLLNPLSSHGTGAVKHQAEVRVDPGGHQRPAPELVVKAWIGFEPHGSAQVEAASPWAAVAKADPAMGLEPAEQTFRQQLDGRVLSPPRLQVGIMPC